MRPVTGLAERLGEHRGPGAHELTAFDSERLERFAAAALTGILARSGPATPSPERAARDAAAFARALVAELNSQFTR